MGTQGAAIHVPAVFVGFSFRMWLSAEFHRGASHKGNGLTAAF